MKNAYLKTLVAALIASATVASGVAVPKSAAAAPMCSIYIRIVC